MKQQFELGDEIIYYDKYDEGNVSFYGIIVGISEGNKYLLLITNRLTSVGNILGWDSSNWSYEQYTKQLLCRYSIEEYEELCQKHGIWEDEEDRCLWWDESGDNPHWLTRGSRWRPLELS